MKQTCRLLFFAAISLCTHAAEMPKSDPLVPFAEIPAAELLPRGVSSQKADTGHRGPAMASFEPVSEKRN